MCLFGGGRIGAYQAPSISTDCTVGVREKNPLLSYIASYSMVKKLSYLSDCPDHSQVLWRNGQGWVHDSHRDEV